MITDLKEGRVCIIGLGLMGASLGMALRARQACGRVIGCDSRSQVGRDAVGAGAIDAAFADPREAVAQADIVVLATPVRTIVRLVKELEPHLADDTLLMDLGSTKQAIVEAMAGLPPGVQAVGGHPMCGKERAGLAAADPDLYQGAVFCLTPVARTRADALVLAAGLAMAVGARPMVLDAERHDRLVAAVSHLPYLMAVALSATAGEVAHDDTLTWRLAASGFRDTSRLAGSDLNMMLDILLTNRGNIAGLARHAAQRLQALADAIEAGDEEGVRSVLSQAQSIRREVYP